MFGKVQLSSSSYDTAWVAMVPSRGALKEPLFPESVDWIMQNQHPNGSWGLNPSHPLLVKDSLSSTLACLLALQKWKVGEQLVQKGLDFISSNHFYVNDKQQPSPIGFDIVFPGMVSKAIELGLNLPLDTALVDIMLSNAEHKVKSFRDKSRIAYVAEAFGEAHSWKEVMTHQRSNGSLFNSPATTAPSLIHLSDDKSVEYLRSLLCLYGRSGTRLHIILRSFPTVYPFDIYSRLSVVDTVMKLGIDRHFGVEIESVLSETYRSWQQRNEEIFLDVTCCASAFRLLRMHGYEVGSDALAEFVDEEHFFSTVGMRYTNASTILELYKAAEIRIFQREPILEKIHDWTSNFLKNELLNRAIYDERLRNEVLGIILLPSCVPAGVPISIMGSFLHWRWKILTAAKPYTAKNFSNLRSIDTNAYLFREFNKISLLTGHNACITRWVKDTRMDQLGLDWHVLYSSHFMVASVHFAPEFSDARIGWSKISVIATIVDDMFDIDGTREELLNIIELVEKWDEYSSADYSSDRNKIVFSALYDTINNDLAPKAFAKQGRCVKHHLINLNLVMMKCMLKEVDWWTENLAPGIDEYLFNGTATIGCGIYFTVHFLLGPELTENVLSSEEYANLYYYIGRVARPMNDYRSDERESVERKVNLCSLLVNQSNGSLTKEDAIVEVRNMIESSRREVLRMMLQTQESSVPKAVKESVWKLSKFCHYLYARGDEFRTPVLGKDDIKKIFYEPINLSQHPRESF
ncbi:hypothetical protein RJ640_026372 [Escallonia rubra]|uniref:Uncharacterized protein n=1 Tax=Escallonia rubra TaxID=112253 RepID=A0AA88QZS0_9ASTE|nr:hypothetical protein RJ640_026372 [Escallonia rubra]